MSVVSLDVIAATAVTTIAAGVEVIHQFIHSGGCLSEIVVVKDSSRFLSNRFNFGNADKGTISGSQTDPLSCSDDDDNDDGFDDNVCCVDRFDITSCRILWGCHMIGDGYPMSVQLTTSIQEIKVDPLMMNPQSTIPSCLEGWHSLFTPRESRNVNPNIIVRSQMG
ncbi:hypothetical protein IV203_020195 [Nitzschia inconspicua]|uniref:Uncharacterized protein n=1 Tax=Nitzschia inconspicua TaxID=303405 RepID=A0A9K3M1D4_9STRA|nr:hypothetical protein IV203_020195 [Nitzschia inconspicua]